MCHYRVVGQHDDPDRAAILARRRRFIALALVGLGGGCTKQPAQAQPPPVPSEPEQRCDMPEPEDETLGVPPGCTEGTLDPLPEPEPVPEDLDPERRLELAEARYDEGELAFREGRYEDALIAWEASYALAPEHESLLTLSADAATRAQRYARARRHYEAYLALPGIDLDGEEAEIARDMLERIEDRCAEPIPAEPSPQPCLSPPKPPKHRRER